jgi:putative DNA primase/helicase
MSNTEYTTTVNVNTPPPPASLDELPFWGVWKRENGTKVPYNPRSGYRAKANDAGTFATRAQSERALASGEYEGLCILVDASLGITAGDLDHVVPIEDAFNEAAFPADVRRIIRIANTWTCWSPSGTGVRFIFGASLGQTYLTNNKRDPRVCKGEAYSRLHFMTVLPDRRISGTPATFNPDAGDLEAWHEALGFPEREQDQPAAPRPTYSGGSRSNALIVETASRINAKFRRLHEGDISGYPESQTNKGFSSEADAAYVLILCGYTGDDAQVGDIWRSESRLYRKKLDRQDYVDGTIQSARRKQAWWFDWESNGRFSPRSPNDHDGYSTPPPVFEPGATCDQRLTIALETIRLKNKELAAARETIARQADRLDAYSVTATAIKHIIASNQIEAGPKLAAVALVMEEGDQQKRGKPAAALGRHLPGSWIAKRAGVSVNTANRHIKRLADAGLVERKVVAERVIEDMVDDDTGEIIPAGRTISRAYYPDQASALIAKFTSYERPDDAPKHGGTRDLRCKHHPDSPTTTTHITTCDACQTVLDEHVTHHTPTGCEHQDGVRTIVTNPKGDTKMVFAPQPPAMPPPGDYSDAAHDYGRYS